MGASIIATISEPLLVLNEEFRVVSANTAFYDLFEVSVSDVEGRLLYELGKGQWDSPQLRALLEDVLPENTSFRDEVVEHDLPKLGRRRMLLSGRRLEQQPHREGLVLLTIRDATDA